MKEVSRSKVGGARLVLHDPIDKDLIVARSNQAALKCTGKLIHGGKIIFTELIAQNRRCSGVHPIGTDGEGEFLGGIHHT